MLPARRLAATLSFIERHTRSTGLCLCAAYLGSHNTLTRGLARSHLSTTLAVWVGALSSAR